MFFGFGTCVYSLFKLQVIEGESLHQKAIEQQLKDTSINAQRGTIYDCNMKPLAQSATVWKVVLESAYLKDDKTKKLVADGLSEILAIDKDELLEKANKHSYYIEIKRKVETDVKDKIVKFQKDNNITSGIRLIEDYKRYYPYGSFASCVIGFTGADSQGLSGIEIYYDQDLTGEPGRLVTARNAVGTNMPFDYEQKVAPKNGNSLVLAIDEVIQHFLEKNLEEGILKNKVVNRATAIMMDVTNGDILGMAVKGDFDLNDPFKIADKTKEDQIKALPEDQRKEATSKELNQQWRNKAVSDTYMPGSVFKIITSAMGFEENIVNEDSPFNCSGGMVVIPGTSPIHCHKTSGHGAINFKQAICQSCNPAFIQLGQKLGPQNFYKYFSSFGLTKKTGIDLPGEANGVFFSADGSMSIMDLAVSSFGQNFRVSPIQMVSAVAAVANGGNLVQPHIVKQIIDDKGNIIKSSEKNIKRQVISKKTSERLRNILQENATTGAAKNGYVAGYRVAGKTGTSEKIGDSRPNCKDYISSYCGFAPADNPKVVLLVFYDTPTGDSYYGSAVAGPTFAKVMEDVLPYLGVERKYTPEEAASLDTTTPFFIGAKVGEAKSNAEKAGLMPVIIGSGEIVTSQIPDPSSRIPKGGRVVFYTDNASKSNLIQVPNFVGLNVSAVNKTASDAGLNVSLTGSISSAGEAIADSQSVPVGSSVSPGTVITINFIQKDNVQ